MDDVKDYTMEEENTHFNGVPSMYGRMVNEQNRLMPDYSEPGKADGKMQGEHSNKQAAP
jgi:hypothetical protein